MFGDTIPSLGETREAVCEIRKSKGMLVRQGGLDSQSAGSFFKNPVVSNLKLREIEAAMINGEKENVPCYLVNEESVKIPAAWLIDQAGFSRGFQKGNAGLSTKHTLALTNRGGAKASEILALKHEIQEEVKKQFGVELATEPNLIGFK